MPRGDLHALAPLIISGTASELVREHMVQSLSDPDPGHGEDWRFTRLEQGILDTSSWGADFKDISADHGLEFEALCAVKEGIRWKFGLNRKTGWPGVVHRAIQKHVIVVESSPHPPLPKDERKLLSLIATGRPAKKIRPHFPGYYTQDIEIACDALFDRLGALNACHAVRIGHEQQHL